MHADGRTCLASALEVPLTFVQGTSKRLQIEALPGKLQREARELHHEITKYFGVSIQTVSRSTDFWKHMGI